MDFDAFAAYVALLPRHACGCSISHEVLCPKGSALLEAVKEGWSDWGKGNITRSGYFALGARFLAHFENGHEAGGCEPEQGQEQELQQMELEL